MSDLRRRPLTEDDKIVIVNLYREGVVVRNIAAMLGRSANTVWSYVKMRGLCNRIQTRTHLPPAPRPRSYEPPTTTYQSSIPPPPLSRLMAGR